jgi:hypothetical protein
MSLIEPRDQRRRADEEDCRRRNEDLPEGRRLGERGNTPNGASLIKDEILLLGLLVLYVGIISTDAYYGQFGLRYQFLSLPSFHIVYRGLTGMIYTPYLIAPFLLAVLWLRLDSILDPEKHPGFFAFRKAIGYFLLLAILASTYPLAVRAGNNLARMDLNEETSQLPKVVWMQTADGVLDPPKRSDFYRLLIDDSSYVMVFAPLQPGEPASGINIKRFQREYVHVIETIR